MSKVSELVDKTKVYIGEVAAEARKTEWPVREELVESTVVVIVSLILMAVFVGLSDAVLIKLLNIVMRLG